jgi:serine/threonine protein kinase
VLSHVARGLRHLHGGGVRHRDLAARNVLVKGRVFKVTDFGLSSVASDTDAARMTSTTIGPVAWRAPETFRLDDSKRQIASVQTDVYMLGGLMFEVLTAGRHAPFFWMAGEGLIVLRATTSINTTCVFALQTQGTMRRRRTVTTPARQVCPLFERCGVAGVQG